ncbi:uncharacterized protein [Chelonus insularis]|uniref:uncharacterized protein n=1 Tax=Chelonus insularis TaxID=460826 RepID=UPI00158EE449|nr:uncharacterized protein LOC118071205 [Chelonus insularis]
MDSIAIVILKTPFILKDSIQLVPIVEKIDYLITSQCVHVKPGNSQDIDEAIFYYGSFNKDAFNYQAKFDKTTLISKSAFENPQFLKIKNKTSLYKFISNQDHDIQIFHNTDEQYLGTPILCPHLINPKMYFQVGIANYFFLVNSKTKDFVNSKKILYYINIVDRLYEIHRKIRKILKL